LVPSLTRRAEEVSEKVPIGICGGGGGTRKEVTRTLRKLQTEELQYLYHSNNIIGIYKTKLVKHAVRVRVGN
jgi:hypothetical protein